MEGHLLALLQVSSVGFLACGDKALIDVPNSPAGAHPSGVIGEDPLGRPGNLLPLLAHMAIGRVKDSTLKVFGNDYPTLYASLSLHINWYLISTIDRDGTCVRDYLHIMDLAAGHLLALEALSPESKKFQGLDVNFKAYNLGRGRGMSVLQIVEAMRKVTGFDYKYEVIGRRWVLFLLFILVNSIPTL